MKKIIICNLIIIFVLFAVCEFLSYLFLRADAEEYMKGYNEMAKKENIAPLTQRYAPVKVFNQDNLNDMLRSIRKGNPNKNSVLFFGCSYMWGSGVEENETLPYYFNEITQRTAVNRAVPGGSIMNMLHDLNNPKFYEDIKDIPKVDYIVYLFISDHLNRISNPYRGSVISSKLDSYYEVNPTYKEVDGKLKETQPSALQLLLYSLYTIKAWHFFYAQNFVKETKDDKMLKLFIGAKKITDEKFPGSKFVIIDYKDGGHHLMTDDFKRKLIGNGFIVLDSETITGHELESEEWRGPDKEHPNGKAFKDLATALAKELKP